MRDSTGLEESGRCDWRWDAVTPSVRYIFIPQRTGSYNANIVITSGSADYSIGSFRFDVAAGVAVAGDEGGGQIIALHVYKRPEVTHVIYETYNGQLVARQNPS